MTLEAGAWTLSADLEWPLGRVTRVTLLVPRRRSSVTGQSTLKNGRPVSFALVVLSRYRGRVEILYHTLTDERGVYLLDRVAAGNYLLTLYGDVPNGCPGVDVAIPAGVRLHRDLRAGFRSISGEIREAATGQILVEVGVEVESLSTHRLHTASQAAPGSYVFHDLPADEYLLRAGAHGFATRTVERLAIEEGQEIRVDLSLEREAGLYLVAVDSEGSPLPRPFELTLRHPGRPEQKCTVPPEEEEESLVLDLEPGDYELVVESHDTEPLAANVTLHEGDNHCRVEFHRQ